jgi:radical SAM protein with 4Fe4S-binding SPASM domain
VDPIGGERIQRDGEHQYPKWLDKFLLACGAHVPVGIVFTLTSGHTGRANDIYHFFRNLQSLSSHPVPVRVNLVNAAGKAASSPQPTRVPTPEEYGEFLYQLWELWKRDGHSLVLSPLQEWKTLNGLSCEYTGSCQEYIFSIDGRGDVYHCGRFADTASPYGNILECNLSEILQHPSRLELQQRRETLRNGHCKDCQIWQYCNGGCPYLSSLEDGNCARPSPLCAAYKLFFGKSRLHAVGRGA